MSRGVEQRNLAYRTTAARMHLDEAGEKYLDSINGVSPESLVLATRKLAPLKEFLPDPRRIISLGTGQGEEIHALHELYGEQTPEIIGIDLSAVALRRARGRSQKHGFNDDYMQGSIVQMPIVNGSVDGVVSSAIMHEAYSYVPNGRRAWVEAMGESFRIIKPGGCLLLREFAAPDTTTVVKAQLSLEAQHFYEYFRQDFRAFRGWDISESKAMRDKRDSHSIDYPATDVARVVTMPISQMAEVALHFRNFWNDWQKNTTDFNDPNWKEINESYLVPSPFGEGARQAMNPTEFRDTVVTVASKVLKRQERQVSCVEFTYSHRPEMVEFLSRHFFLGPNTPSLLDQMTRKLVAVFQIQ